LGISGFNIQYPIPNDQYPMSNKKDPTIVRQPGLCAPVGIQTPNLLIRSQMLYSVELRVPKKTERKCIRLWPFDQSPHLPRPTKNLFLTLFLPVNYQKQ
jgi:hypothetical protein